MKSVNSLALRTEIALWSRHCGGQTFASLSVNNRIFGRIFIAHKGLTTLLAFILFIHQAHFFSFLARLRFLSNNNRFAGKNWCEGFNWAASNRARRRADVAAQLLQRKEVGYLRVFDCEISLVVPPAEVRGVVILRAHPVSVLSACDPTSKATPLRRRPASERAFGLSALAPQGLRRLAVSRGHPDERRVVSCPMVIAPSTEEAELH